MSKTPKPIHPEACIGHVHLKVADLDRAIEFYSEALGFGLQQKANGAAFLSAGGYHHHIGLNTWESAGSSPAPAGTTGLFHLAILYPDRAALGQAVERAVETGAVLEGAADHGVSEAVYLRDPDDNGIELYWDKPQDEWPRPPTGEGVEMYTRPLDLAALIEAGRV